VKYWQGDDGYLGKLRIYHRFSDPLPGEEGSWSAPARQKGMCDCDFSAGSGQEPVLDQEHRLPAEVGEGYCLERISLTLYRGLRMAD
jgi:hypothetical protein